MLLDILGQIFRTLWAHKLRSFLTMFGVAWGVGSLLLLVGLGEGFRSGNKRNLAEFGENIMFIFPGRTPVVAGNMSSARNYLLTIRPTEASGKRQLQSVASCSFSIAQYGARFRDSSPEELYFSRYTLFSTTT